jgi:hypothetical protein
MRHPHGQTVTIVRAVPGGTDVYGDPIPGTVTRIDVPGTAVASRYSTEPTERGRQGVIVGLTIYPPANSGFLFTDQVEVKGALFDVEGDPGEWENPFTGDTPGMEIALKRAVG